jgi:signal recognition particle receptor subunit beta
VAVLDPNGNSIVISVIYDGAPEAGKTTSVKTLASSLGREVYTPEERNGRTVFFDWMEYTGGRFEGAPIRCQIASVPGQRRWVKRRGKLLDLADVVVFVGDTRREAWPETLSRLQELRARLDARGGVPVGVVFQANKRDHPDAVAIEAVRQAVERIGIVESVASIGIGIRESFVLAVRLALDRVREETQRGTLQRTAPSFAGAEEVLGVLRTLHDEPEIATAGISEHPTRNGAPRPPSPDAPSGVIWPPVDGRVTLHEASSLRARTHVTANGDCVADVGPEWSIHSEAAAIYGDLDEGRAALVAWARQHASAQGLLSKPRCIVLSETGDGRWRLWQIVKTFPSLRDLCGEWILAADPDVMVRGLATASRALVEARQAADAASVPLACTIDSVGIGRMEQGSYIGLVPHGRAPAKFASDHGGLHELASLFDDRSTSDHARLRQALAAQQGERGFSGGMNVSQLLAGLLTR